MYLDFFGLKEKPFSLTPDPRFLFLSESHRQALDHLLYGIREREGFILIVGDIGTGKTTICRELLEELDKNVASALILNPMLSEQELLEAIVQDFAIPLGGTGIRADGEGASQQIFDSLDSETQNALELNPLMPGRRVLKNILEKVETGSAVRTKKEIIDRLNAYLISLVEKGGNAVLIIDEAQNLSAPVLEQIRILSNLETTKRKLLQIVLVGQLELKHKLEGPDLRQLNQRISIRYRLKPLSFEETKRYVEHRLFVAGSNSSVAISDEAFGSIYDYSRGVPRLVNLICERALLASYVDQVRRVNAEMIARCRDSLDGDLEEGDSAARPSHSAGGAQESRSAAEPKGSGREFRLSEADSRPEDSVEQPWERKKGGFFKRWLTGGGAWRGVLRLAAVLALLGLAFVAYRTVKIPLGDWKRPAAAIRSAAGKRAAEVTPAVRLAFSIQLGAYQTLEDGIEQSRLFGEQGLDKQLYIVPLHLVQLGGRWYRLFYGGFPSKSAARAELDHLVERGVVKAGSGRIVETSLAFSLGDYADRASAEQKRSEYMTRWNIPSYVFALEKRDDSQLYRLYTGAFEGKEQASFLADRIAEAGLSQVLVERLGYWPLN